MKKNILITFDYELFLGKRSGIAGNCLISPTDKILEILDKHNVKAVFFIDTIYIKRLEEIAPDNIKARNDLELIIRQLGDILGKGHYLYHHIHPHWLDAIYLEDINQWDLSNTAKFTFNSISEDERAALFSYSCQFLNSIYSTFGSKYKPDGFRAGGLYIEPFTFFKNHFLRFNIKYEFSVVPGIIKTDENLFYNFLNCPKNPFYNFTNCITKEEKNGVFSEFTITLLKVKGIWKLLNGIYYRLFKNYFKPYGDGIASAPVFISHQVSKSFKRFFVLEIALSIELFNPVMKLYFLKLTRKKNYLHFISHPKLLSESNLKHFDKYLQRISNKNKVEFDFRKFNQGFPY